MLEEKTIKEAKILIVDDQPANVTLIEKMLDIDGYINVISTTDPTQVESIYMEQNSDLILLDLNMPVMDGETLVKWVKASPKLSELPVIVITSAV